MNYLNEEDIDTRDIMISKNVIHLDKYDMYYINFKMKDGTDKQVRVFCEKGTFPSFDSDLFKRYQKNYPKEISIFFIKRLLGPNGLMAKSNRDDYIYLGGEFLKDGCVANRGMIQSNGKTGQENFEDNFFKTKMRVEAIENKEKQGANVGQGKNYVIADIHGMYGSYIDAIRTLTSRDHLYIIGDVIDRGNEGIEILKDIMKRVKNPENNPKITFMLGNHEMQFIESVGFMINYRLNKQDLIDIINRNNIRAHIGNMTLDKRPDTEIETYRQELKRYETKVKKITEETKIPDFGIKYLETWLTSNKGATTIFKYLECNPEEKKKIYEFMYNSYVALPQKIKNKDYLLVHAMPPKDENMLARMKQTGEGYKFSDLTREQYEFMLQTRESDESTYEKAQLHGFTTICGHEAELGNVIRDRKRGYIRVDAGCGHKQRRSKLALYCIEDERVKYIDEKEESVYYDKA